MIDIISMNISQIGNTGLLPFFFLLILYTIGVSPDFDFYVMIRLANMIIGLNGIFIGLVFLNPIQLDGPIRVFAALLELHWSFHFHLLIYFLSLCWVEESVFTRRVKVASGGLFVVDEIWCLWSAEWAFHVLFGQQLEFLLIWDCALSTYVVFALITSQYS